MAATSVPPQGVEVTTDERPAELLRKSLTSPVLRFVRFGIVGGSGVVVNMALLWLLHDRLGFRLSRSSVAAIAVAILNNFLLNNFWTFGARRVESRRVIQFVAVSLVGMVVNVSVLNALVAVGTHYVFANLAGIMLATGWNFYVNSRWTWGRDRSQS